MKARRSRPIDFILAGGVTFSIVVALVLYLIGLETIFSTLIALLGIMISLQIDTISRMEAGQRDIKKNADLWEKMGEVPWLHPLVGGIIESTHTIAEELGNDVFVATAKRDLEESLQNLQEYASGNLQTRFDDFEPVIAAVESAQSSVFAISILEAEESWWQSWIGRKYWEANTRAIARGVAVERVFVLRDSEQAPPVIDEQIRAGVTAYVATIEQLSKDTQRDIAIIDGRFLYEGVVDSQGNRTGNNLSVNQSRINKGLQTFQYVRALSNRKTL